MSRRDAHDAALPAVATQVLEGLHQHRLLSARQVQALHLPANTLRWTRQVLCLLEGQQLCRRSIGPHGMALWYLSRRGAEAIRTTGTLAEPRLRLASAAEASGPLRRHTLAVNETGIAFVAAARARAGDDCGPLSWRHEIAHPIAPGRGASRLLIADAILSYLQATDEQLILHQRFIELDRGTIPPEQLASKLTRYAQLRHYTPKPTPAGAPGGPLWRVYYRSFPQVLVVLADQTPAAARRRIQRVIALHHSDPSRARYGTVPAAFVTLADLAARGPFAPIFIPAATPDHYEDWLGQPARPAAPSRP